jgi:hypothetical protein
MSQAGQYIDLLSEELETRSLKAMDRSSRMTVISKQFSAALFVTLI